MAEKKKKEVILLPEGRLINNALFERDIYKPEKGAESEPKYKIEMVFDPAQVQGEGTIEDQLLAACFEKWGDSKATEDEFFDGKIQSPYKDGTAYAAERATRGKPGDAYKGKVIMRADTKYNSDGVEGPGGIYVVNEENKRLSQVLGNAAEVYNGSYGQAAVVVDTFEIKGQKYVKLYLNGYQKTRDGDKLTSGSAASVLFKPVGRTEAPAGEGRRVRRG